MPAGHFAVTHGNLTVNVPRDIFKGPDAEIIPSKAEPFREMLKARYPWLKDTSLDVLMRNAQKELIKIMDEETRGRSVSRSLESQGKIDEAVLHLKRHLEEDPNDADSWYALGELLCRAGRAEEGYKAFARGRKLF